MVEVWLPYGKVEICARIPAKNYLGKIEPKEKSPPSDPQTEIIRALKNPIGSKPLSNIVSPDSTIALVVDDTMHTTPNSLILPAIMDELNSSGVKDTDLTIIIARGSQRTINHGEMENLLGGEILERFNVVSHNPSSKDHTYIGTTSFGTKVHLDNVFLKADVKILASQISLHSYAGYDGGRKSVLPGLSSKETIQNNHGMILHQKARTGVLNGNPVHEDMVQASKLSKVDFALNVVSNHKMELVKAFAGDLYSTFHEGVKLVDEMYKISVDRRADIVVTSAGGYPHDVTFNQAYEGIHNALNAVKRGGIIILTAECAEKNGNEPFYEWMTKFKDLRKTERAIKRRFAFGGHKAYLLKKALQRAHIILVSVMPDYYVTAFNLKTARIVNDALLQAFEIAGKNAKVWVMPHGNLTLPIFEASNA
jgi:nickel-dependent lactate racemase